MVREWIYRSGSGHLGFSLVSDQWCPLQQIQVLLLLLCCVVFYLLLKWQPSMNARPINLLLLLLIVGCVPARLCVYTIELCMCVCAYCLVLGVRTYIRPTNRILENGNLDTNLSISGSQTVFSCAKPCIAFNRSSFTFALRLFAVVQTFIFGRGKTTAVRFNLSFIWYDGVGWRFCPLKILNGPPLLLLLLLVLAVPVLLLLVLEDGDGCAARHRHWPFWLIYLRSAANVRLLFTISYASESGSSDNNCSNIIFT